MKKILTFLLSLVTKPVKKLTLDDFLSKVKALAIADGKTYYQATVTLREHIHADNTIDKQIKFSCYVDGYNHYTDNTMEGALDKLKEVMKPTKEKQIIQEVSLP
jgi:hypothetical protein